MGQDYMARSFHRTTVSSLDLRLLSWILISIVLFQFAQVVFSSPAGTDGSSFLHRKNQDLLSENWKRANQSTSPSQPQENFNDQKTVQVLEKKPGTEKNNHNLLSHLPKDIQLDIIKSLNVEEIASLRQCNKESQHLIDSEYLGGKEIVLGDLKNVIRSETFCEDLSRSHNNQKYFQLERALAVYMTWDAYFGCLSSIKKFNEKEDDSLMKEGLSSRTLLKQVKVLHLQSELTWYHLVPLSFPAEYRESRLIEIVESFKLEHPHLEKLSIVFNHKSLILHAIECRYRRLQKALLPLLMHKNGKDNMGRNLIHAAVTWEHLDIVKYLVSRGVDPYALDQNKESPLIMAIKLSKRNVVSYLLDLTSDINQHYNHGKTALMYAIENRDLDIIELILNKEPDLELFDEQGWNALLYAIKTDQVQVFQRLAQRKVNLDYNMKNNVSAFMLAIQEGKWKVVQEFILHNFNVDHQANDGKTALMLLSKSNKPQILKNFIVKRKPKMYLKTFADEFSAMHFAAKEGKLENVKILLKFGANPLLKSISRSFTVTNSSSKNAFKDTRQDADMTSHESKQMQKDNKEVRYYPIDLVNKRKYPELVLLLEKAMKKQNHYKFNLKKKKDM